MGNKKRDFSRDRQLKDFINGKVDSLVIRNRKRLGHLSHRSGAGEHDSRPKRERTRFNQQNRAINEE